MTAITKAEFYSKAVAALNDYPTIAKLVAAGDPRVLAQLSAQAAMLAMLSDQVELAQYEPFVKSRAGTILADAAMKGVLPTARSCRGTLTVTNGSASTYTLAAGRVFLDPKGRHFEVESGASIAAGASAAVRVIQRTSRAITHTVTAAQSFYQIQITPPTTDVHLAGLEVWRNAYQFAYNPDYTNVVANELSYTIEVDEQRRMYVCFGKQDVVGYGVAVGDAFELRIAECEGAVTDLAVGDSFALQYVYTAQDGTLSAVLDGVSDNGADPLSTEELRVMARYPSIYDVNAVYLGEFDFLLRRHITGVVFLSVWNEQHEERVRGANAANINTLFVSGIIDGMTWAAFQAAATTLLQRVDDSYRLQFVSPVETPMAVAITAQIPVVYDSAAVSAQIKTALLEVYGRGQPEVSRGVKNPVRKQAVSKLLRSRVPALRDVQSDFDVVLTLPTSDLPEVFMPMVDAQISVTVTQSGYSAGLWNT